ncbi:MAG: PAS domain S-box protein [Pirellulales bacterium]|nr:PAS domain S-box protein [Pirellulales bacterium]
MSSIDAKNQRILVIDDSPAIHDDFRKILGALEGDAAVDQLAARLFDDDIGTDDAAVFEIDSAYQGQEALAMVQQAVDRRRPYAMAFVDVRMPPGWDGIETTCRIWEVDPEILVVICTAFSDHRWEEIVQQLGRASHFLILKKPFDNIEVRQLACSLTDKWEQARAAELKLDEMNRRVEERAQAIRASEARMQAIMETAADAIIITDTQGVVQSFNKAAEASFGYAAEEMLGRLVTKLMPPSEHALFARLTRQFLESDGAAASAVRREITGLRKDGTEFPADLTCNIVETGCEKLMMGIIRDITERKQAEMELRRERDFNLALIESSTAYIAATSPDGIVHMANESLLRALGYTAAELIGKNYLDLVVPPEERHRVLETTEALMTGKMPVTLETEILTKEGARLQVVWGTGQVSNAQGETESVFGVGIDITERKRGEHELKQYADALERANRRLEEHSLSAQEASRTKSEFLANMSHEIRTPMTAILGFSENLLLPDLSEEDRVVAVETIRRNGKHLLALINDILDLSKVEAGKLDVERIACSPGQVIEDVRSLMHSRALEKGLEFQVEYATGLPETILSDPTRLRQILINLVGNAVKFTEEGSVWLVVGFQHPQDGEEPFLYFEVTDTGIGMTPEQTERLFQPFAQADSSTTRRFGGTGLGLTICKRLSEKLGGTVEVSSQLGVGSTFRVTIATGKLDGVAVVEKPAATVSRFVEPQPALAASAPVDKLDCRVLLAEDAPDNQRLICLILNKLGARVTVAENGQIAYKQAMEAWRMAEPFDVVLMDMQMPILDGYQTTRRLREQRYTGPIVALTAHAMASDRAKCLQAGCDAYLSKPIERERLTALVAEYARQTIV